MVAGGIDARADDALTARVRAALAEAWFRNAALVAWLRVGIRAVALPIFALAWVRGDRGTGLAPPVGTFASAAHLAIGVAVLVALRRRPRVRVVAVGAASDVLVTGASAFLHVGRVPAEILLPSILVVLQLALLMDALTMSRRMLAGFAAATWLVALGLALRAGLSPRGNVLLLLAFGAFSLAISVAGNRIVALTARASLEAVEAELVRSHRDELQRAHDGLRAAQREAEILSDLLVHDLRNPLATIWASLERARDEVPAGCAPALEALDVAGAELRRVTGMTGDLLLIHRLEHRDWDRRAPVQVATLLADAERPARTVVERAGATLTARLAAGTPAAADLDAALIRRVLDNLLSNAVRHVGPGDRVELAAEPSGDALRLAVRNSGPPVPAEARARLFEKDAAAGRARGEHFGLGLYLCRLVAERHGGVVALADRPGWSVSFEVLLPTREAPAEPAVSAAPAAAS